MDEDLAGIACKRVILSRARARACLKLVLVSSERATCVDLCRSESSHYSFKSSEMSQIAKSINRAF